MVEWPEKIDNKIDNKIDLFFEYAEDMNKRYLSIKGLSKEKLNEINMYKLIEMQVHNDSVTNTRIHKI